MSKLIAVTGATGNQGGSVVRHFQTLGWRVRAITRNPSSESAKALASSGVELAQADLDDVDSLVKAFEGADVVFGVTDFWGIFRLPTTFSTATAKSIPPNVAAMEHETAQGNNIATAASRTPTLSRYIWSTLSDTKKWTNNAITHNYHFDSKAAVNTYIETELPDLAKKSSWLQVGCYLSNLPGAFGPTKSTDGTLIVAIPSTNPDALIPFVHPPADTGRFVEALVSAPAGKTLLGTSEERSWVDYTALLSKVTGKPARFETLSKEGLAEVMPAPIVDEIWASMTYFSEFGYDGGDPEAARPWDLGVKREELLGVETYLRGQDWSEVVV